MARQGRRDRRGQANSHKWASWLPLSMRRERMKLTEAEREWLSEAARRRDQPDPRAPPSSDEKQGRYGAQCVP